MNITHNIVKKAIEIEAELIKWRRDFHRHPELGFKETRTASEVEKILRSLGWSVRSRVGRTGVVARKGEGAPCIALRADMDALPIEELNDCEYRSLNPGIMHACGHDAHTAMLLGVATILRDETFKGSVRLFFQPSEEQDDDEGKSGAVRMIEDGAMDGVTAVAALHVNTETPVGQIQVSGGTVSAGSDSFFLTISGKGGHAAYPHNSINPIGIAGHMIVAFESVVSRFIHPNQQAVVNFGAIHGGDVDNVVPEEVNLIGTIRYRNNDVQKVVHEKLHQAVSMAQSFGGSSKLTIDSGYPPTKNNEDLVQIVRETAHELLGPESCLDHKKNMGAEDFSYFCNMAPGVLFSLGCQIENDVRYAHNPYFDIDERCLSIGAAMLSEIALRFLKK